ncbi:Hypothetical predicted protein [Octopus vulgaris]|uniref:Uncharacterized protein n=1 Tax=Octopus vulgaris TaxID=6645 RepID=A0AA36FIB4_OCTVU|nr:Hypothetical predicted protein [Octopus vulgaris]
MRNVNDSGMIGMVVEPESGKPTGIHISRAWGNYGKNLWHINATYRIGGAMTSVNTAQIELRENTPKHTFAITTMMQHITKDQIPIATILPSSQSDRPQHSISSSSTEFSSGAEEDVF